MQLVMGLAYLSARVVNTKGRFLRHVNLALLLGYFDLFGSLGLRAGTTAVADHLKLVRNVSEHIGL